MAVHRHRSPRLWVSGTKPLSSTVALDRGANLSVGLSDLVLFDGGRLNPNLATPAYPAVTTGNPTSEIVPSVGLAMRTPGANTDYQEVSRTDYNFAAADATISILFQPQAWAGAFNDVLSKNSEFGFYTDTTGAVNAYNVGGAAATVPVGVTVAVGETARLTIVRTAGGNTAWYKNGAFLSSQNDVGLAAVAGSTWQFGRDFGADTPSNIRWADFFVWSNRALTASEVARHYADPYSMLRPVFIPRRVAAASAGLAANLGAVATQTAALTTAIRLAAGLGGVATLTASLTTAIPLAASLGAVATVTASLGSSSALAANLGASASLSSSLSTAIPFFATLAATSTLTAALSTTAVLVGGSGPALALNPLYNPTDAANLPAGVIATRAQDDAIMAAFIAGGRQALTLAQLLAITGPAPAYPISLPRFDDSNPEPRRRS